MAWHLGWPDVTGIRRLQDNDVVRASFFPCTPAQTRLVLELAPHLSWWKGLVVRDNSGKFVGEIWCQDRVRRSRELRIEFQDIEVGGTIELWKAKAFGIHTHMYTLPDMRPTGSRLTVFRWSAD